MSDDDLRKLPSGAIDWLRDLLNPSLPADPDLDRLFRSMLPFPNPDDLGGPYNAFTGQPLADADADFWRDWCLKNNLIRAVPWAHDVLHELTPLGRRALELADAASPAGSPQVPGSGTETLRRLALSTTCAAQSEMPQAPEPPPPRLTVDLRRMTITLDGQTYDVGGENVLRWVRVLSDHQGEWISGPELRNYDEELQDHRTSRWRKVLPEPIRNLIDSATGKGSRIRLE